MSERKIQPVQNNAEKQQTYRKLLSKYNRAMEQGFYCEALMIDYAMIEDRLRSMIYHMGLLPNRASTAIWKKARAYLQQVVDEYKCDNEDNTLGTTSLSSKIKIVRSVCLWAANTEGGYQENVHLKILKNQLESIDLANAIQILEAVDCWRSYRNEVVHAMMNKNIIQLEESFRPYAEQGMKLARDLDSIERGIKSGNKIRRKINLPMT